MRDKGIKCRSKYFWQYHKQSKKYVLKECKTFMLAVTDLPAYNLSELGEMFPFGSFSMQPVIKISSGLWTVPKNDKEKISFDTEVDARAYYLLKLIENGEVTVDQINRLKY
jgi:hypothetical protein